MMAIFVFNPFHTTGLFLYFLKTRGLFLMFSEGIERDQWHEMDQCIKWIGIVTHLY